MCSFFLDWALAYACCFLQWISYGLGISNILGLCGYLGNFRASHSALLGQSIPVTHCLALPAFWNLYVSLYGPLPPFIHVFKTSTLWTTLPSSVIRSRGCLGPLDRCFSRLWENLGQTFSKYFLRYLFMMGSSYTLV